MKKTLQEYLDQQFASVSKEDIRIININADAEEAIWVELKKLEGGVLDLNAYPNLERVKVDGSYLGSPLTSLILGNQPQLKEVNCSNNRLTVLDFSGCPELAEFNFDGSIIDVCKRGILVDGWEKTKLVPAEFQEKFAWLLAREKRLNEAQVVAPFKCNIF